MEKCKEEGVIGYLKSMPGEQFEHLKIDAIENMSASFHIMVKF